MLSKYNLISGAFGGLIGLAVGGGLYGLYVSNASKAAFISADAYSLLGKCVVLESEAKASPDKIREFIRTYDEKASSIAASDSVIISTAIIAGNKSPPAGLGKLVAECTSRLRAKYPPDVP